MSKFLTSNFRKKYQEQLEKTETFKKLLSDEELKTVAKKFMIFENLENEQATELVDAGEYETVEEAIKGIGKIYIYDRKAFIIIETPDEPITKPMKDEDGEPVYDEDGNETIITTNEPNISVNNDEWVYWPKCKFKLGSIMVSGFIDTMEELSEFGLHAFVQGSISQQFNKAGTNDYEPSSLEEFCKKYDFDVDSAILNEDYYISYNIIVNQVIEKW